MSHGQFFNNFDLWLIHESYICNIYIFGIRILWRILWEYFRPRIFRIRPRKILKIDFLWNAWAIFFSFSNSKTTQKSTSNDIHWYKVYPTHAHAERIFNFWGSLTPTHDESIFERLEIVTIMLGRFDYPKKVRNQVYLAILYTEKSCFSRIKWKRLLVFSQNHNNES